MICVCLITIIEDFNWMSEVPREMRYAAGDETYRGRQVQETGLEA